MLVNVILVIGLGVVLGLDVRAAVQGMFSHPLVAGTLTGLVMGDAQLGFEVGALVGVLWVHMLPVGGAIPPNVTVIAMVTVCLGILTGGSTEALCLALLWSVPFGQLARRIDGALRQLNVTVSRAAISSEPNGLGRSLALSHAFGLSCVVVEMAVSLSLALLLGSLVLPSALEFAPAQLLTGLSWAYAALPVVGLAAVVRTLSRRYAWGLVSGLCLLGVIISRLIEGAG